MNPAVAVAAENHRLLAHAGNEVVAGLGNLRFVAHKEPGAGEDLLLLLGVNVFVDKNLAADLPLVQIDDAADASVYLCRHLDTLPAPATVTANYTRRRGAVRLTQSDASA